jgi:uncharacterized protein
MDDRCLMKMSGHRQLSAKPADVWLKLNDVAVLRRCIPGCESLEQTAENELKAVASLKVGPMQVRFTGNVSLSDLDPPNSYRISGQGSGGAAGMASGGATVKLTPSGGGTQLSYDVDANVGGKIAQLGQRLIDATAAQMAEKFFTSFAAEVEGPPAPAVAATAAAHSPAGRTTMLYVWWGVGALLLAIGVYLLAV